MRSFVACVVIAVASVVSSSCDPPPRHVWIPGDDFEAILRIALKTGEGETFRAGQWISLHAERATGPWQLVEYESLAVGERWLRQPPPQLESGVEANVRWIVEPSSGVEFNLPTTRELGSRSVRFNWPGRYRVWAQSHAWGGPPVTSNVIALTVEESR